MSQADISNERVTPFPRRWLVLAGAVAFGVSSIVAWEAWQNRSAPLQQSQPVATPTIATVTALGRLEPVGQTIDLTAPTAIQESRLAELGRAIGRGRRSP
ncbi:MAG: hypothetical protein AAFY11_06865 [Cyanobacteria bacterium J06641_5]